MSGKLVGRVYDEADLKHPEQSILVAMADHARDDGTKVFPSVERIAWKTGYSVRQVHRIIANLKAMGVLVVVKTGKKGENTEYRIVLSKAPKKMPFNEWRNRSREDDDNMTEENGTNDVPDDTDSVSPHGTPTVIQPSLSQPSGITPGDDAASPSMTRRIMDAFLEATGLERFTHYGAAGSAAKKLADAGFTDDDIPDMVRWAMGDKWLANNLTINNLASKADAYRIARANPIAMMRPQHPAYYRPNGGLTAEGMAAKARGEIQ